MEQLEAIRAELARSSDLPAYEALDVAWLAVIKVANLLSGDSEHRRLIALLNRLPEDNIRPVLQQKGVDALLNLDPQLESVLTSPPHERLAADHTVRELAVVREKRGKEPREALRNLTEVLKRVRNRRAHGFKTPVTLAIWRFFGPPRTFFATLVKPPFMRSGSIHRRNAVAFMNTDEDYVYQGVP